MKRRWRIALWAKIFFFCPAYGSTSVGVVIVNEVSIQILAFLTSDSNISSLLPFLPTPPHSLPTVLLISLCACVCLYVSSLALQNAVFIVMRITTPGFLCGCWYTNSTLSLFNKCSYPLSHRSLDFMCSRIILEIIAT